VLGGGVGWLGELGGGVGVVVWGRGSGCWGAFGWLRRGPVGLISGGRRVLGVCWRGEGVLLCVVKEVVV